LKTNSSGILPRWAGLSYRNAEPLQRGLQPEPVKFTSARAASQFAAGEVDVALVPWAAVCSSGWEDCVVPGTGIASAGEVFSVFIAWEGPGSMPRPVSGEASSRSSAALFEVLRREFSYFGKGMPPLVDEAPSPRGSRLMIGDAAIDFRRKAGSTWQFLDLSAAWHECTGLPFVFAVWVARGKTEELTSKLAGVRDTNLATIGDWISGWEDPQFWMKYYARLRYRLGETEEQGMELFRSLLCELAPRGK
jgi:chorismate dehydratase